MIRAGLAASIALVAVAALPATSQAAAAGSDTVDGDALVYAADAGEQNRLLISRDGDRIVFQDDGATITAGRGCQSLAPNRMTCERQQYISVHLEDGDDEATSSGNVSDAGTFSPVIQLYGGIGDDTLRGSSDRMSMTGGPGEDFLEAGSGTGSIHAVELMGGHSENEMPEQAGEADRVTCVPFAAGPLDISRSATVDELDTVSGACDPVYRYTRDFIVVRGTEGNDNIGTPPAPSRIDALGGDDYINTSGRRSRAAGGAGNDVLFGPGLLLGGDGDDRLEAGFRSTIGARLSGDNGNDQLNGSDGSDRFVGGPGFDRMSSRGGNDLIRSRDGSRDKVRCGAGRDTVIADRLDGVARDCERVMRG